MRPPGERLTITPTTDHGYHWEASGMTLKLVLEACTLALAVVTVVLAVATMVRGSLPEGRARRALAPLAFLLWLAAWALLRSQA